MHEVRKSRAVTRLSRLATVLVASGSALLSLLGPAHAATSDIPDYQAALALMKSADVRNAVCRFLGVPVPQGASPGASQPIPDKVDPCAGFPAFTVNDPLALNEITPGFVTGAVALPTAADAFQLSYLVAALSAPVNGRNATVMLAATKGGGWHLAAVRDGDTDAAYAGKAAPGSLVFTEPQIRGWYQLTLTTVEPLNDQARQGLNGQSSVSLLDYQKLVKARYADKLPGSSYDTAGMSSGYGAVPKREEASAATPVLVGGSGVALVLAGGAFALRRRRRSGS